jgi:RsiW-degrading membrane proteinase PrsW (M82 family)
MNILALALGPVAALLFFVWAKDRYERDPFKYLLLTLGAGVISAIPVVIVEMLWIFTSYDISALTIGELSFMTFVEIGLTEEFFKALAFFIPVYWSKHFNEPYDGILYGVAAALGFAGIENVMYVLMGGAPTAFLRAITAVPAHAMFGLFIGYFAGRAKFTRHKWAKPFLILTGFVIAVFLHGLYDLIAMWPHHHLTWLLLFPLLGIMVVVSFLLISDARSRSPFKPEKDELGRYTGYTVSGTPLNPKIAAKLRVQPGVPRHDGQGVAANQRLKSPEPPPPPPPPMYKRPSASPSNPETGHFLDEYLLPPAREDSPPSPPSSPSQQSSTPDPPSVSPEPNPAPQPPVQEASGDHSRPEKDE